MDHPLARGLVGCWLMNENSGGIVNDYSGQGNTGTLSGFNDPPIATSGWNAGPHGGALAFDGVNDYVNCGRGASLQMGEGIITLSIWILTPVVWDTISHNEIFFGGATGGGTGYGIMLNKHIIGSIGYETHGDSGRGQLKYTGNVLTLGKWQLVTAIFNGIDNYMKLYVDGVKRHDVNIKNPGIVKNVNNFLIGTYRYRDDYLDYQYKSLISSVMIYNRALSAEEIAYLYAFPYCMFDDAGWEAWMARTQNFQVPHRNFEHYYRRLMAA